MLGWHKNWLRMTRRNRGSPDRIVDGMLVPTSLESEVELIEHLNQGITLIRNRGRDLIVKEEVLGTYHVGSFEKTLGRMIVQPLIQD
jgi:hypothetical protein